MLFCFFNLNVKYIPGFNVCFHRQDIRSSFEIDVEVYSLVGTAHIRPKTLVFIHSKGISPSRKISYSLSL